MQRSADRRRPDPGLPPPVRRADEAHRLAGRRGAGPGARRGVLRAPRQPALPGRAVHPQAARARLPRGARRLPRRLRPCADADEPGHRRLHPGLRRRRPARASGSACWPTWRASTGTRWSSAWCSRRDGLRIYGAGIASSSTESVFALDDASPNRIRFDLERVMRTPLPDRRLPGDLLRHRRPGRAARARPHRFRAALRARARAAGVRARPDAGRRHADDAGYRPIPR